MLPSFSQTATPRLALPFIAFVVALCTFAALDVPEASANGGVDTRTIFEEQVEGYQVVVTSTPGRPTEGVVHFTFSISDASDQSVVTDAILRLSMTPPAESDLVEASFEVGRSEVNADLYDVNVDMEAEGVWPLLLTIDGPLGVAEADFSLEVRGPSSKIFAILIVVLAFPMLLVLLEIWRRWDRRKKRAQQKGASDVSNGEASEQGGTG